MIIKIESLSKEDYERINKYGWNADVFLDGRIKLVCQDDEGHTVISFMEKSVFDRLGISYIEKHAVLEYLDICKEWFMKCSQNDWYNDQLRHPDKTIPVKFIEIEPETGREVYRGIISKRYYLREVFKEQMFARWYVCGARRMQDDGDEVRPNLIFQCGEQQEKVIYGDSFGVAACEGQFNTEFRSK